MASIHLTHLNDDTSWLLTFRSSNEAEPFNLVIDPWLKDAQVDYFPLFSRQMHVIAPRYDSLTALQEGITGSLSAILLSHEFTDHCHQETLKTVPSRNIPVFAHPAAKKRLDGWGIFESPAVPFRIYNARKKTESPLPDTLAELLARSAEDRPEGTKSRGEFEGAKVLYIPTNDWLDPGGNKLHGLTLLVFTVDSHEEGKTPCNYSIMYSPHGVPPSALAPVVAALNALPHHQCLALIHNFDFIRLPLLGKVNLGKDNGAGIVDTMKPRYWIRTHDEMKKKEGLVGMVLQRTREDQASVQQVIDGSTKAVILASGETLQLL